MEYRYEIRNFNWIKEDNTFYAEALNLMCQLPDGSMHPEAFPNGKKQFYIHNNKTGGFRRFNFVKETSENITAIFPPDFEILLEFKNWIFESEDGIKCSILVDDDI